MIKEARHQSERKERGKVHSFHWALLLLIKYSGVCRSFIFMSEWKSHDAAPAVGSMVVVVPTNGNKTLLEVHADIISVRSKQKSNNNIHMADCVRWFYKKLLNLLHMSVYACMNCHNLSYLFAATISSEHISQQNVICINVYATIIKPIRNSGKAELECESWISMKLRFIFLWSFVFMKKLGTVILEREFTHAGNFLTRVVTYGILLNSCLNE